MRRSVTVPLRLPVTTSPAAYPQSMCECESESQATTGGPFGGGGGVPHLSRRGLFALPALLLPLAFAPGAAATAATSQATMAPNPAKYGLDVHPRADWADAGKSLPIKGELKAEPDVRMLLVHHSATRNTYTEAGVADQLRSVYSWHTGKEKGWPDIAYNFLVDRFGGVWEGRAGSLAGPIAGSATGGNQGFTQLVTMIGDFTTEAPTAAQQDSVVRMLATLADAYGIDTALGATATFTSKGSNKHKAGKKVSAPTIDGHRSMSFSTCPGDAAYALVPAWRKSVHKLRN
jgi:N-acetylmuramoyl-L-alanine amidase